MRKALTHNTALFSLSVLDATGHIAMNTQKFSNAAASGKKFANSTDLNTFIEKASDKQKSALGEKLGINDWNTVDIDSFRSDIDTFATSDQGTDYAKQIKRIKAAKEITQESTKVLPRVLRSNMADGAYRFSSENGELNMAVLKEGENYFVFDYDRENISRPLKISEVNKVLKAVWDNQQNNVTNNLTHSYSGEDNTKRFAIVNLDNGMQYVQATESQVIKGDDSKLWAQQVTNYINNVIRNGKD